MSQENAKIFMEHETDESELAKASEGELTEDELAAVDGGNVAKWIAQLFRRMRHR